MVGNVSEGLLGLPGVSVGLQGPLGLWGSQGTPPNSSRGVLGLPEERTRHGIQPWMSQDSTETHRDAPETTPRRPEASRDTLEASGDGPDASQDAPELS